MKNLTKYKIKQIQIFFRFLKEYKLYQKYRYIFFSRAKNTFESSKLQPLIKHNKRNFDFIYKIILKVHLYEISPINFIDIFNSHIKNEDFFALKALWCYEMLENKNNFNSTDIKYCLKYLKYY